VGRGLVVRDDDDDRRLRRHFASDGPRPRYRDRRHGRRHRLPQPLDRLGFGAVLSTSLHGEVVEAERELEEEVEATRDELAAELRAISERLRQLEARL
jgi:hypothetical protein